MKKLLIVNVIVSMIVTLSCILIVAYTITFMNRPQEHYFYEIPGDATIITEDYSPEDIHTYIHLKPSGEYKLYSQTDDGTWFYLHYFSGVQELIVFANFTESQIIRYYITSSAEIYTRTLREDWHLEEYKKI